VLCEVPSPSLHSPLLADNGTDPPPQPDALHIFRSALPSPSCRTRLSNGSLTPLRAACLIDWPLDRAYAPFPSAYHWGGPPNPIVRQVFTRWSCCCTIFFHRFPPAPVFPYSSPLYLQPRRRCCGSGSHYESWAIASRKIDGVYDLLPNSRSSDLSRFLAPPPRFSKVTSRPSLKRISHKISLASPHLVTRLVQRRPIQAFVKRRHTRIVMYRSLVAPERRRDPR